MEWLEAGTTRLLRERARALLLARVEEQLMLAHKHMGLQFVLARLRRQIEFQMMLRMFVLWDLGALYNNRERDILQFRLRLRDERTHMRRMISYWGRLYGGLLGVVSRFKRKKFYMQRIERQWRRVVARTLRVKLTVFGNLRKYQTKGGPSFPFVAAVAAAAATTCSCYNRGCCCCCCC